MAAATPIYAKDHLEFYKTPNSTIEARENDGDPLPVLFPNAFFKDADGLTTAQKIERLIEDDAFQMQINPTGVTFVKVDPEPLSLKQVASIDIPLEAKNFCYGPSGKIYYTVENTIFRWDPIKNMLIPKGLPTCQINALTEFPDGKLIAGDDEGFLHFPDGTKKQFYTNKPIQNILPLSQARCLICFENTCYLFDIEKKAHIQDLYSTNPVVMGEDSFLTDNPLRLWKYNEESDQYLVAQEFDRTETLKNKLSDTKVILYDNSEKTILFDLSDSSSTEYTTPNIFRAAWNFRICPAGDESSFFHSQGTSSGSSIGLTSSPGETINTPLKGWGVTALMPLTDSSIICGTGNRSSRIYILSNETGAILFDDLGELTGDDCPDEFHKLPDGTILVRYYNPSRFSILKLNTRGQSPYRKRIHAPKEGKYRSRLYVGEGTFSGIQALIEKHEEDHPDLAKHITATEFGEILDRERIRLLQEKGVQILFGIDGTKLETYFSGTRFERIHWNHPFGGTTEREREAFKKVIPRFFRACSELQLAGDRVHVTLADGSIYRQAENPIAKGATNAGYLLIRKRKFGVTRYPGYQHNKTGKKEAFVVGDGSREFIFEKANFLPDYPSLRDRADSLKDPEEKEYTVKKSNSDYYIECSSDEDSSSYED